MTKIYLFLTFIYITSVHTIIGQDDQQIIHSEEIWSIFADKANVRHFPNTSSHITDVLHAGDIIGILKSSVYPDSINGKRGFWYNISYQKEGLVKEGYVWEGLLSSIRLTVDATQFLIKTDLAEIEADHEGSEVRSIIYKIKAIQDHKIIAEYQFKGKVSSSIYSYVYLDNKLPSFDYKLSNVENIITLYSSGDACAIPSCYYYLAWTGKEILPILKGSEVGDDSFFTTESIVFPGNNIPKNIILKMHVHEDKEGDEDTVNTDVYIDVYKWNGKKAVLLKQAIAEQWEKHLLF